ncbi:MULTISPECIES: bifunctional phosphopantothenoylcysteine decarboxylase/phosphopantothenate--cysteine ligase CoaBC [Apibacter]|uniref:bifunctional phosphopantothenoylcysteine decarboxylase/phosphopantothenate--cysteine ligase CoaBC n=1 Tax=Apibacter TaxID=1778601 RepID=UPI001323F587|nr:MULTISPECIES: bifunctional phosphopantothenoylcysteine decarboxylase/phosphopantothenate--cysteine ligase CoaBC [Apibacter]MXO33874.1 bifunctional phosphopantothenoylcysteine decarboxylase/phosphopantothenate--cysteine ligase CoaBC [Apibacter sp. B3883]MXO41231.1 bifunctional phosphopantothenoylcysteine decarboxylase/phosphopantothenate--cysteine ligase CoaBC [Apibacter sp. B3889]MXP04614.1 bifunctional phosphopantothenoylcysteine decarboxylase/phosphopantothenate--cysteine ligase CoaBC [Apib
MSVLEGKKIVLIITGGIAAYKTASLVRLFMKRGCEVQVIMTPKAHNFITPLTLSTLSKKPVYTQFFEGNTGEWNNHVDLALHADYLVVAPATSNTLSKMASAEADNLALATYLSAKNTVFFAPAMDLDMYKNPYNQENIKKLQQKGDILIPPNKGELASGLEGEGRMAEPEEILDFIENYIRKELIFYKKKLLITAGPTYEPIDPVRFIGNHSSGKMGFEIAKAAEKLGAEVTLVSGPTCQKLSHYSSIKRIDVMSSEEMYQKVTEHYQNTDIVIMAAAVADYRPETVSKTKIKKNEESFSLPLLKNKDILLELGKTKSNQFLVGFALETNNEEENALTKLNKKNLNMIVLNSLQDKGAGFSYDTNKITILDNKGGIEYFDLQTKEKVAENILKSIHERIKT